MWFKSFGNVPDGTAFVMRLPLSALTATTAPTAASAGVHTGAAHATATHWAPPVPPLSRGPRPRRIQARPPARGTRPSRRKTPSRRRARSPAAARSF
eukprot:3319614-Prymnesium_polylepis.1